MQCDECTCAGSSLYILLLHIEYEKVIIHLQSGTGLSWLTTVGNNYYNIGIWLEHQEWNSVNEREGKWVVPDFVGDRGGKSVQILEMLFWQQWKRTDFQWEKK